jgi:predicted ATPase
MSYIRSLHIKSDRIHTYPFNFPAIKHAQEVDLSKSKLTFFIGENGSGKSTLIEALARRDRTL